MAERRGVAAATGVANDPLPPTSAHWNEAFDLLATMVAVVQPDGRCLFANAAFENVLGLSRRSTL